MLTTIRTIPSKTRHATVGQDTISLLRGNLADVPDGPNVLNNDIPEPQNRSTWSCEDSLIRGSTTKLATNNNIFVCSMVQFEHHHTQMF